MSDPDELMSAGEIARMFGNQHFKAGAFRRFGIPIAKEVPYSMGDPKAGVMRFAYRRDVEAALARHREAAAAKQRIMAEQHRLVVLKAGAAQAEDAKPALPPAAQARVEVMLPLVRAIENLTHSVSVLADRIERVEQRVTHLSDLWEPPTTTPAVNGTAHS